MVDAGLAGCRGFKAMAMAIAMAIAACVAGCAHKEETHKAQLSELASWIPGNYDNLDQIQGDIRAGRPASAPVALVIVSIYAPTIGKDVFFAEELASNDPNRVLFERLLSFAVDKKGDIIQTNYALKDPQRWRTAHLNPELFEGLQPPDLRGIMGCPIVWKRDAYHYTATEDAHICQSGVMPASAKPLAELTQDEYVVARRVYDLTVSVRAGAEEPLDRFRKRGAP